MLPAAVPVAFTQKAAVAGDTTTQRLETPSTTAQYVGSKNGTKYHALWCPGASQIKDENKVFFNSKEEAVASGYAPATNCKGL